MTQTQVSWNWDEEEPLQGCKVDDGIVEQVGKPSVVGSAEPHR